MLAISFLRARVAGAVGGVNDSKKSPTRRIAIACARVIA
jgi:hypothetical protein